MAMKRFVCVLAYSGSERFVLYFKLKVVLASEKKRSEKLGFLVKVVKNSGVYRTLRRGGAFGSSATYTDSVVDGKLVELTIIAFSDGRTTPRS
jgi:hypothetical protein